ncbi:MAG: HTTM domain-containing protein [Planctomycetales bacterium]
MILKQLRVAFHDLGVRTNAFFFREEIPYGMAMMRICLTICALMMMVPRWFWARELYTRDGAWAPLADLYGYQDFLPVLGPTVAIALYSAMILFLFSACIGWQTRISLCGATVLFAYFCLLDSLGTNNKYTVITTHGLLLLSLSAAGSVWSVDAWLAGRWQVSGVRVFPEMSWPRAAVWPQRLVMLLIGIVYFGAAITKMHTPAYFSGDQMIYWMLTNVNSEKPLGEWLTEYPTLVIISAYIAIVWEVLFLFLCWKGWGRVLMLGIGVAFHTGTFLLLGLTMFPLVAFSMYLAFLSEEDVQWFAAGWRRWKQTSFIKSIPSLQLPAMKITPWGAPSRRQVLASAGMFGMLLVAAMCVGVEGERRLDVYGMNGPDGPLPLRELSEEETHKFFAQERALRESDKFFSFEIGKYIVGGRLFGRQNEFRHGDRMQCEVSLNPPHEDMWIDCVLQDDKERTITRVGQVCVRENLRCFYNFVLGEELVPGEYRMALFSRGQEVLHRTFRVIGKTPENSSASTAAPPLAN